MRVCVHGCACAFLVVVWLQTQLLLGNALEFARRSNCQDFQEVGCAHAELLRPAISATVGASSAAATLQAPSAEQHTGSTPKRHHRNAIEVDLGADLLPYGAPQLEFSESRKASTREDVSTERPMADDANCGRVQQPPADQVDVDAAQVRDPSLLCLLRMARTLGCCSVIVGTRYGRLTPRGAALRT